MIDILEAVYKFILQHAHDEKNGIPVLSENQIVRAWQNYAALPDTTEYVVITYANKIQHGKSQIEDYYDDDSGEFGYRVYGTLEHVVQVDFSSQGPDVDPQLTAARAQIVQILCASPVAPNFFKKFDSKLNLLYCDDIGPGPVFDESQNYQARYVLNLHISQIFSKIINLDYFTEINLKPENVDAHHPAK